MIQLWPHQQEAIALLRGNFVQKKRKVVLCLPTGAGKTMVFSYLAKATLDKDKNARILILTHRIELLTQAGGALQRWGIEYEQITASKKYINPKAKCYVGMVETYYRRIKQNPHLLNMSLVIIDEAHYGNFKKLFEKFSPNQYVIGATATPISAQKNDPLSNYYDDIVCPVQIEELIDQKYLSPVRTFSSPVDRAALQRDFSGEYSDASQMQVYDKREVYENLLDKYRKFCLREDGSPTKTIIFNVNIQHSLMVTRLFNEAGISARHVDGETPYHEREQIIREFREGKYSAICNVGILNAGFDDPTVETIVVNRATTSIPLWHQMAGRGSRVAPGKTHFTLLDMGDNHKDLGLWQGFMEWPTYFRQLKEKKPGVAPVKDCPGCGAILPIQTMDCPTCGHHFEPKEKEAGPDAEFVQVDGLNTAIEVPDEIKKADKPYLWPTLSVRDLDLIQRWRGRKVGWVLHVIKDRSTDEHTYNSQIREYAQLKGYKPGWAQRQQFQN